VLQYREVSGLVGVLLRTRFAIFSMAVAFAKPSEAISEAAIAIPPRRSSDRKKRALRTMEGLTPLNFANASENGT